MKEEYKIKKEKLNLMFKNNINNIQVNGLDNIPTNGTNIFVVNHNCFLDIYLIPHVLNIPCISMVSSNSLFGINEERKKRLNELLYPYPIETRANKYYKEIIFKGVVKLLKNKKNIIIFPQGVFDEPNKIYKARTGIIRMLFDALGTEKDRYNIISVALHVSNVNINNIQSSDLWDNFKADISILPPFVYNDYYNNYKKAVSIEDKKIILHNLMDDIMKIIAYNLNFEYIDKYRELYNMDGFWFPNGEYVEFDKSENELLYDKYSNMINSLVNRYIYK